MKSGSDLTSFSHFRERLAAATREEFYAVLLDNKNRSCAHRVWRGATVGLPEWRAEHRRRRRRDARLYSADAAAG